jgi:NCAIR mutase (PurE)-related protein
LHSASPFRAKDNLPATPDGVFRVVLVAAGSESAWHVPAIVASLTSVSGVASPRGVEYEFGRLGRR